MQNPDNLVRTDKLINEGTTAIVICVFQDDQTPANPVVPNSAVYTLYDKSTGAIINSRNAVAVPTSGATGTIELTPADNVILDDGKSLEEHRLYVKYTYNGTGTRTGGVDIQIPVFNVKVI